MATTEIAKTSERSRTYSLPAVNHPVRQIIEWCFSGSVCDASTGYKIALTNMPSESDRGSLAVRHRELMTALHQHDRKEIGALVAEMLASYDVTKQRYKTSKDKMEAVAKFVQELKGVPTWAVSIACERIRMGIAPGISHVFEPTTIQLRVLAVEIAQPYKQEAIAIGNIVTAEHYQQPVSAEQRARVGELLAGLSRELRERVEIQRDDLIERDRPRAQALTQSYIEQEYRGRGEEPVTTNKGMLVSRSLAQQLGKLQPK